MSGPTLKQPGPVPPDMAWWPERQVADYQQSGRSGRDQDLERLQGAAGNRAANQMIEEEARWASEFEADQRRLVEVLRSSYYSADDEREVVDTLIRWSGRRTVAFRRRFAGTAFIMRSDYLDRLFERLRQEPIWSRNFTSGKTNCYEVLFSSSFERAADVRNLRDANSIAFIGREEQADEQRAELEEEDRFAQSLLGWQAGEFEFLGIDRTYQSRKKAEVVIQRLAATPEDRLTPMQRLMSAGIARDGIDFLLRQYRFVSPGDKLRQVKAIAREVVVLVLDYALMEMTMGVAAAAMPKVLELALGSSRVAGAARGAASLEATAAGEVLAAETRMAETLAGAGKLERLELTSTAAKSLPESGSFAFPMKASDEMAVTRARQLAADTEAVAIKRNPVLGKLEPPPDVPGPEVIAPPKSGAVQAEARVQLPPTEPRLTGKVPETEASKIELAGKKKGAPRSDRSPVLEMDVPGVEGELIVPPRVGGAASEEALIGGSGDVTKLNDWFKTLDGIKGGEVRTLRLDGKVVVEFTDGVGVSVKTTFLDDSATNLAYLERKMNEAGDALVEFTAHQKRLNDVTHVVRDLGGRELQLVWDQQAKIDNAVQVNRVMERVRSTLAKKGVEFRWFRNTNGRLIEGEKWFRDSQRFWDELD